MAIDGLAINGFDILTEKRSNVFVGRPVQRHAQVIAVLRLEFILQVLARKQVSAEPIKVGELLVRQLVQLAVWRCGEARANEVFDVKTRIGEFFAFARHVVRQRKNLAVAVVRADQVRVRNPAVVNALAGLHRGLQFLHNIPLLDDVMLDLDARDFLKRLGQRFRFVLVRGDGLGHDRNLFDAFGFELFGRVDEPLHFGGLFILRQGGRLELGIDPFFGRSFICPRALAQGQGSGSKGHGS